MIVLKADSELKMTFERLIKTMHANVNWTGLFVALDNYLILQGEVRSLFFHFDSRKVAENIVDLPIKEDEIKDTDEAAVRDVINMILYAFGKWGTIQGLRVEKNTEQLNTLFGHVLAGIYIEPEYTTQYFRFYHAGKRITYEDVIQAALEAKEAVQKEEEADEEQGLWHKVEWKMAHTVFERIELSLSERAKGRIGNNFYKVGYRCPKCKGNLHMIMYPKGKEFRIETPEGVVLLAKACTCAACHRFYTPRPWKLLGDGDIYLMDFEEDKKAYEDYLELMGRNGEHEANSRYNQEVVMTPITDRWAHSTSALGSCYAVTANSTPEEAQACVDFLGLLYTDSKLADLYTFGIEGEDFNYVDGKVEQTDAGKYNHSMWESASATIVTPLTTEPDDKAELYKDFNGGANTSCAAGFRFDKNEVADKYAACQNVFNEYGFALENGGYGVDQIEDTIAQYQAALDEAGYQDVLAAFQAQYDEWKAENGSETTDESVEEESSSVAE